MNCLWCWVFCIILNYPVFGANPDELLCRYHESRKEMDCSFTDVGILKGKMYPLNITVTATLNLHASKLQDLEFDAFEFLSNLQYLDLGENYLEALDYRLFSNLKSLIELNLSSNRLKGLHSLLFKNVTQLKKLYLDNNMITRITDGSTFISQSKLYFLSLQNNKLTRLKGRVLKWLSSLTRMDLSGNPLTCDCELRLAMLLCTQTCIETGAMCQNPPSYNGESWTVLRNENCSYNSEDISPLGIKPLEDHSSDQCKDKRCHYEADSRFMDCTEVKLRKVNTGKYPLQDRQLNSISLRSTGLTELKQDTFTKFTELYSIDLGENSIENLDNNLFSTQKKLTHLYLDYNRLVSLSDDKLFQHQTNLEVLSLQYNELNYISDKVLHPLNSLNTLLLQGNPFNCDCNLLPALLWCESRYIFNGAVCKHPQQQSGSPWEIMKNTTESCNTATTEEVDVILIVISVCVALTVSCCLLIAVWIFWKRSRLQDSRADQNVTYDDVKSSDCYYETIDDVSLPKMRSSIPPDPPKRTENLTVVALKNENVYDDAGSCRSSGRSASYIIPKN